MDTKSPEQRSRNMARVRSRDTQPEMRVRKSIHAAGFRYRLHPPSLPGRPDLVLPRYRTAVFVHGCFWHGHDCRRGNPPRSNVAFWGRKLATNRRRDTNAEEALRAEGYHVVIVWECDIENAVDELIDWLSQLRRRQASKLENA
jgi:DNA mismatch endonuclease, patch repair protein